MTEKEAKQGKENALKKVLSRTWEVAMRLRGNVVVNDATLFL